MPCLRRRRGAPTGQVHVQVGVFDRDGCLKYSLQSGAANSHAKGAVNTLLAKAVNEYKATLMSAGEKVPEVDTTLQE